MIDKPSTPSRDDFTGARICTDPAMSSPTPPLCTDPALIAASRALDAGWAAAVAVQERITGRPFPDCFTKSPSTSAVAAAEEGAGA